MGTFANIYLSEGAQMPQEKVPEFRDRLEKLFQAGGMMEIEYVSMFGVKAATLKKAWMHEDGMNFYYNYFEEDTWENAGYDLKKNYIWSGKIGYAEYNRVVVAAYVLKNLYTDGIGSAHIDGDFVNDVAYTGWINYLFNENFHAKNRNPWKLFETVSIETGEDSYWNYTNWNKFAYTQEGAIANIEIYAVKNGVDKMLKWLIDMSGDSNQDDKPDFTILDGLRLTVSSVQKYHRENDLPTDDQFRMLCEYLKDFYQNAELKFPYFDKKYDMNGVEGDLFLGLSMINMPVVVVKTISEEYDKDFWELWKEFRDVARETHRTFIMEPEDGDDEPVSTADFMEVCEDDMIYFWREDGDISLSDQLKEWFSTLKRRYDEIVNETFTIENPIKWVLELMNYAQEEYYNIFTFSEFFEESIMHLSERNYIALWKLYEEMLYDPEMEKAGNVVFVPDGPEHENEGLHYLGQAPRRRLMREWEMTDRKERDNNARVTLRRYMALVANAELRKKVFGF